MLVERVVAHKAMMMTVSDYHFTNQPNDSECPTSTFHAMKKSSLKCRKSPLEVLAR